jgi:hypothetical protein
VTHVAWAWDAGSSTVSNTDGNITSSVRASQAAGFSIVSWTAAAPGTSTIGHGLSDVPAFVITKSRSTANHWAIFHKDLGQSKLLRFTNDATLSVSNYWGSSSSWTSSTFCVAATTNADNNIGDMVAYCFAPVAGFSAMGSYTANGSTDGPYVHTNFAVAWLMTKRANATASWEIHDLRRPGYNPQDERLLADSNTNEVSGNNVDFLSNGFKIRNTFSGMNSTSGDTYVYIAFAENPFQANGGLAR